VGAKPDLTVHIGAISTAPVDIRDVDTPGERDGLTSIAASTLAATTTPVAGPCPSPTSTTPAA